MTRIQSLTRGCLERARLRLERHHATALAAREQEQRDATKAFVMSQCSAVVEKQGRVLGFGGYEMTLWSERHVYLNENALVYQHLRSGAQPLSLTLWPEPRAQHPTQTHPNRTRTRAGVLARSQ